MTSRPISLHQGSKGKRSGNSPMPQLVFEWREKRGMSSPWWWVIPTDFHWADAGVDKIRISIQGLSGSAYNKDETFFKNFIENLKFLYQNKKNTNIYIKIIDCALDNNEKKFFEIFGDICDFIAIEHMIPAVKQINYDKIGQGISNITQNGLMVQDVQVCPQPFYFMQINPDGNIIPCCSMETPVILGNLKNDKLKDIWLGDKFKIFRQIQLLKEKNKFPVCKNCQQYKYMMFPEDNIDNDANGIMERMN